MKIDERAARLLYNNQTEIRMTENEFVDAFLAKDGLMPTKWYGIHKATEECGELLQCLGKLNVYPTGVYPDGENWRQKVIEEIADVRAALDYFVDHNLSTEEDAEIEKRRLQKLVKFNKWGLSGVGNG